MSLRIELKGGYLEEHREPQWVTRPTRQGSIRLPGNDGYALFRAPDIPPQDNTVRHDEVVVVADGEEHVFPHAMVTRNPSPVMLLVSYGHKR
jgi:hypothetical protein